MLEFAHLVKGFVRYSIQMIETWFVVIWVTTNGTIMQQLYNRYNEIRLLYHNFVIYYLKNIGMGYVQSIGNWCLVV